MLGFLYLIFLKLYILFILIAVLVFYLLPPIIAVRRRSGNRLTIVALNILAGWTFVGWAIAFVLSITQDPTTQTR